MVKTGEGHRILGVSTVSVSGWLKTDLGHRVSKGCPACLFQGWTRTRVVVTVWSRGGGSFVSSGRKVPEDPALGS